MAARTAHVRSDDALSRRRQDKEHEHVLSGILEQLAPVFFHSPDGVYLYLDDNHKVCNARMAEMFGVTVDEWRRTPNFLESFVAPEDRELVALNFQNHIAGLTRPVTFRFKGIRKNGDTFIAETEMIPISWNGYPIAYHFVREIK